MIVQIKGSIDDFFIEYPAFKGILEHTKNDGLTKNIMELYGIWASVNTQIAISEDNWKKLGLNDSTN